MLNPFSTYLLDMYDLAWFKQFLPCSGRIDTAVWMHYLDAN